MEAYEQDSRTTTNIVKHGDNTKPNQSASAQIESNTTVVASHYNIVRENGLSLRNRSPILHMRNFNNWIKSQLISEYIEKIHNRKVRGDPFHVLDLCSGKGGDLQKWAKGNVTHVICTDIAEGAVEQCRQRYKEIWKRRERRTFNAEFISCDSTLVRLREHYKDSSIKFDLVSCQFAFHYAFESLSQADCMIRNATECLKPGGYFIASIPNANEIMRRLRNSESKTFGNKVYQIEFLCETNPPPLFGAKYIFHLEGVVDCPEFLVHFPTFVKICKKHGLELEMQKTFAEYYEDSLRSGQYLLQRMNCLETLHYNQLKSEEYEHVTNLGYKMSSNAPIGTISKTEWEAITLYMVCAFKKVKAA